MYLQACYCSDLARFGFKFILLFGLFTLHVQGIGMVGHEIGTDCCNIVCCCLQDLMLHDVAHNVNARFVKGLLKILVVAM